MISHYVHKKQVPWSWRGEQQQAFQKAKGGLNNKLICHVMLPSPYGVGTVLSHKMDDGTEHPVAFAFCTPSPSEKKYAQLDKEGLAVVFGVKHFTCWDADSLSIQTISHFSTYLVRTELYPQWFLPTFSIGH